MTGAREQANQAGMPTRFFSPHWLSVNSGQRVSPPAGYRDAQARLCVSAARRVPWQLLMRRRKTPGDVPGFSAAR